MKKTHIPRVYLATAWPSQDLVLGVTAYAAKAGWHLNLTNFISGELPEKWQGDGIITLLGDNPNLTEFVKKVNIPTVSMTMNNQGLNVPCVDIDNNKVGQLAASHFIDRGFKHYAFYSHNNWPVSQLRSGLYHEKIEKAGYFCNMLIWDDNRAKRKDTWNNRAKWLQNKLAKLPKPAAIFAVDDMCAVELIESCMRLKLRIPEDISILGVGNSPIFASSTSIGLSSINIDNYQIGFEASRLLDQLMQGNKPPKDSILFQPLGIITRRSTDTIATENPDLARAVRFILDNFHRSLAVDDIVEESEMCQTLFYKAFQDEFNQSPARFLTSVRLKKAKQMLKETDLKTVEISDRCGFVSTINLFRVFKRYEGIGPKQYRKSIRKIQKI